MNLATLYADLERDEDLVLHAYQDSSGYWTIGCGRLIDKRLGGGISESEARILLDNDIQAVLSDLDRNVPWWRGLDEPRMRGLMNMCFNLGWPRLSRFKNMLSELEAGDYESAAAEALNSKWALQVGARAQRIAKLFNQ